MLPEMKVTARTLYGRPVYYPACPNAQALARVAGTKTLTAAAIGEARTMGFRVIIDHESTLAPFALAEAH